MKTFAFTFPGGRHIQTVESLVLVNNVEKIIDYTCPAGKRQILLSFRVTNPDNVGRNILVRKFKEVAKTNQLAYLFFEGAATFLTAEQRHWPNTVAHAATRHRPGAPVELLAPLNTIEFTWAAGGASAGATDADGLTIEALEMDL